MDALPIVCCRNRTLLIRIRWAAMDAPAIACSRSRTLLRRHGEIADCCVLPTPRLAARTSSNMYGTLHMSKIDVSSRAANAGVS